MDNRRDMGNDPRKKERKLKENQMAVRKMTGIDLQRNIMKRHMMLRK
jgi:hypothetical protein